MKIENKTKILQLLSWYATSIAAPVQYKWSDEYSISKIKKTTDTFNEKLKELIDFSDLTIEDCEDLYFRKWDDESGIYLIPLYLLPILPIGIEVSCIDGRTIIYDGTNIDNDNRAGLLAYGIKPNK